MQLGVADPAHQHIAFAKQRALPQAGWRTFSGMKHRVDFPCSARLARCAGAISSTASRVPGAAVRKPFSAGSTMVDSP